MRPIRCRKHLTQNDLHKKHKETVPFKKKLDSRYRRGHAPPVGVTSRALIVTLRNASSELILARRASEGRAAALGDSLACASG